MQVINIENDEKLVLDAQADEIEININKCRVVISDISSSIKHIKVNDGYLDYCYINKNDSINKIDFTLNRGMANLKVIDILNKDSNNEYTLNLNDEDSEVELQVASISKNKVKKDYKIRSNNNVRNTKVKIDCFGISQDSSLIKYDVTSFIKKGAKQSVVNQNSKILLFDKESGGINNPVLEIEENDVKANHGSSIGMIDEETLFYLTSRGIKEEDARNLVSLGKINYIIEEVKEEKIKDELLSIVNEGV